MDERLYWLGFSLFPGIGPKKFQRLLVEFSSAGQAWNENKKSLTTILGVSLSEKFIRFRRTYDGEKIQKSLEKGGTLFHTLMDKAYPELLKQSINPPFVLYQKGEFDFNARGKYVPIGVVGARKITSYGKQVTAMIIEELVQAGCVIVSGLALGVDSVAHTTTVDTGGKTVAVLGCGIECCYPVSHKKLYDDIIASGGAVVSEFPFDQSPSKGSFPSRNRIIAGLVQAVVVTEGAEDSGALITAEDSFLNSRPVFAVPGPVTSRLSKGPHSLLVKGATLVTNGQDIIRALGVKTHTEQPGKEKVRKGDTKDEQRIIDVLQNEVLYFDEVVKKSGMDAVQVGMMLSLLEMKGVVQNTGRGFVLA